MRGEHLLDLRRGDVLATADDHLLDPSFEVEVPITQYAAVAGAELHDGTTRSVRGGPPSPTRSRIIWCRVGPADSQVAPCSRAWGQNRCGVNRRGAMTAPPAPSAANVDATRP